MILSFYCKYNRDGASSRMRVAQFLDLLASKYKIKVDILLPENYISRLYNKKSQNIIRIVFGYINRFIKVYFDKADIIIIEKELFPYLPYFFERVCLKNKKYIIDIDDAVFLNYELKKSYYFSKFLKNKFKNLFANAYFVFAGSKFLIDYSKKNSNDVIHMPTVVDVNRYCVKTKNTDNNSCVLGWIGTPSTYHYFKLIEDVLIQVSENLKSYNINLVVHVIGAHRTEVVTGVNIKHLVWSESAEVDLINDIDIGIMPLLNTNWEKGKCAYKLIQYMACAKPVIASEVGENKIVVEHGVNGYLAKTKDDWIKYITELATDSYKMHQFGKNGRTKVELEYSISKNIEKMESIFNNTSLK